jgi:indole-3-glycerol phosphate synthase
MKEKTILDTIVARVTERLPGEKAAVSLEVLQAQVGEMPAVPSFFEALRRGRVGTPAVIAELKKGSPSRGVIREEFPVAELAGMLEAGGAAALSVLTERDFFFGAPEYLQAAVARVNIPVLRKDFIVDEYQVYQARCWGASAILLIAAALERDDFFRLLRCADELGLDVLAETHNEDELKMVLDCGARIIGVNSRNLKTFEIDLGIAQRMMAVIPAECVRVAESGVKRVEDMRMLREAGADAFLIGETLMRGEEPGETLKQLLEQVNE